MPRRRARTMPIEAPTAKVMATIWKGGMGPATTDSVASAPHSVIAPKPAAIARRRVDPNIPPAFVMGGA